MAPLRGSRAKKRAVEAPTAARKRVQLSDPGSKTQPLMIEEPQLSQRTLPRKALATAASQATEDTLFESQLRDLLPETAIVAPTEGSKAATVAITEVAESGDEADNFNNRFVDDFKGIDWARLPRFQTPLRTLKQKKSWVFRYGYRVALRKDLERTFFICKYCHQRKILDVSGIGMAEVTYATSSASAHLATDKPGHRLTKLGTVLKLMLKGGQTSIATLAKRGVNLS